VLGTFKYFFLVFGDVGKSVLASSGFDINVYEFALLKKNNLGAVFEVSLYQPICKVEEDGVFGLHPLIDEDDF